jgi:hypothetical protein
LAAREKHRTPQESAGFDIILADLDEAENRFTMKSEAAVAFARIGVRAQS